MFKYFFINCVCILSLSGIGTSDDLFTFAKLAYEEALKVEDSATKMERYTFVEQLLTDYIQENEQTLKSGDSYYYLGKVRRVLKKGGVKEAFAQSLSLSPKGEIAGLASLELGVAAYESKEWEQAIEYLKGATQNLKREDLILYSHHLLANVSYTKGDYATTRVSAEFLFQNSKNSKHIQTCHLMLARIALSEEEYPEAYKHYKECLEHTDTSIKAEALEKCAILSQTLDQEKSVEYCELALDSEELKSFHPTAALVLMTYEAREQNLLQVLEYEEYGDKGLSQENKEQRLYLLAKAYDQKKESAKAVGFYRRLSELSPSAKTRFEAAYIIFSRKTLDKVTEQELQKFLSDYEVEFKADSRYQSVKLLLAEKFYQTSQLKKALEAYQSLDRSQLEGGNLETVDYKICKVLASQEDFLQVKGAVAKFVEAYPLSDKGAYLNYELATLAIGQKKISEAKTLLEKVLTLKDLEDPLKFNATSALANVSLNENAYKESAKHYATLIREYGEESNYAKELLDWTFWLAYSHYKVEAKGQAKQNFTRLRSLDPEYKAQEVTKVLALIAYKDKRTEELRREVKRYSQYKEAPLPSAIYAYLGLHEAKQNNWQDAWDYFSEIPPSDNNADIYNTALLELYVETAIETNHYKEALNVSRTLQKEQLPPYNKARNFYREGLATLHLLGPEKAEDCVVEAIKINPAGELKYQLLLLHGRIEYGIGNKENATRLLRQVAYFAPDEYKKLKKEALIVLIDQVAKPSSKESQATINEYKKELEILQ